MSNFHGNVVQLRPVADSDFSIHSIDIEEGTSFETAESPYIVPKEAKMTDPTREEIDAKLAAVEARLETGLVRMEGKIDNVLAEIRHVAEISKDAKEEARQAKIAASNIKWNVGFTVLAAVGALIAVILTMWTITYQVTDTVRSVSPPAPPTSTQ